MKMNIHAVVFNVAILKVKPSSDPDDVGKDFLRLAMENRSSIKGSRPQIFKEVVLLAYQNNLSPAIVAAIAYSVGAGLEIVLRDEDGLEQLVRDIGAGKCDERVFDIRMTEQCGIP